jgi:hypothetical protein
MAMPMSGFYIIIMVHKSFNDLKDLQLTKRQKKNHKEFEHISNKKSLIK